MAAWHGPDGEPFRKQRSASLQATLDARLAQRVAERLRTHPRARRVPTSVQLQNGVSSLSGAVDAAEVRRPAGRTAAATEGVRDVCNMLSAPRSGERLTAVPLEQGLVAGSDTGATAPRSDHIATGSGFAESPAPPSTDHRIVLVARIASAWWLLCVLITALGWTAVLIGCVGAALVLKVYRALRR